MTDAVEMLVNATAGGVGSATAKVCSYPFERMKAGFMAKAPEETAGQVLAKIQQRGWYTGLSAKMTKSVTQKFIYFYLYEGLSQLHKSVFKRLITVPEALIIGYLAELLGIPAFAPLETITVQIQTGSGKESMGQVVQRIYKEQGIKGFYGAIDGYVIGAVQPAIQFTIYEQFKAGMLKSAAALSAAQAFWLGAVSKAVAVTVTYPPNLGRTVIQARAKSGDSADSDSPYTQDTVVAVMAAIYAREGFAGLYKGWLADLFQGLMDAAVMMMVKEKIQVSVRAMLLSIFQRRPRAMS